MDDTIPTVTLPVSELTINQAAGLADDGDLYYVATMPRLFARYPGLNPDNYWRLTVAEHQVLVEWADG